MSLLMTPNFQEHAPGNIRILMFCDVNQHLQIRMILKRALWIKQHHVGSAGVSKSR